LAGQRWPAPAGRAGQGRLLGPLGRLAGQRWPAPAGRVGQGRLLGPLGRLVQRPPGGNVTGVTYLTADLEPKRLGLLHGLVPRATAIAVLVNPANANAENQSKELEQALRPSSARAREQSWSRPTMPLLIERS
jgi:hypothetical protein